MRERDPILVVDDSTSTLEVIRRNLDSQGYRVFTATSVPEAIQRLETADVALVITDLRMPKIGGLDLIRHIRANYADTGVIMITGFASVDSAVSAMREGAEDYLAKPFTDEELQASVARTLEQIRARRAAKSDRRDEPASLPFGIIGNSPAMHHVYRSISKAAATSATVLITGESGTGKELVARAVHYESARAAAPFVAVNCAAIPESLVESELFGHTKGAFTGASTTRAGFFVTADGGTIFLDEIAELAAPTQAKLLRILEDGEVRLVGSDRPRTVDARVIAATNKDLAGLVSKSAFREDLFFRLHVLTIELPPLRERGDDVLLLIHHFIAKFAEPRAGLVPRLTDRALRALQNYHWPGNVRELQNVIQRVLVMSDDDSIDVSDLPSIMRFAIPRERDLQRTLADVERDYIRDVLASVDGNKTRAAEILGIDRKTLREKLNQALG
ncbi:MAG: sigma-54-dependent Fis family transcriptional regulator [Phycisphaerales bacterium]|nr:sigma-54-dependent Fis family transcriptional regulator [Phycisphaerales bacterium]